MISVVLAADGIQCNSVLVGALACIGVARHLSHGERPLGPTCTLTMQLFGNGHVRQTTSLAPCVKGSRGPRELKAHVTLDLGE
jgi:hypothetical protein